MWFAVGFDKHLYFCTGIFSAGLSRQVLWQLSVAVGLELSWTFFPFPYMLELCADAHSWIDCSAWPIHDLSLASLHPFSSLTASWSRFRGFCISLRYALTCSTLCRVVMYGRSSRQRIDSIAVSFIVPKMTVMVSLCTLSSFSRLDCDRVVRPRP